MSNEPEEHQIVTPALLAQCPVWSCGDDERLYPVHDYEPLPDDRGDLFVKADFLTPGGVKLEGCLLARSQHFVAIFVGDDAFYFNRLIEPAASDLERLDRLVPALGGRIFPLRFATPFHFAGEGPIVGEFDINPLKLQ